MLEDERAADVHAKSPKKFRRRRLLLRILVAIVCLILLITVDYFAYPYGSFNTGRSGNHGENGIWLRYTWYFGQHNGSDIRKLATNLASRQIRYAYFHVRSIKKDGSLKYRYGDNARALLKQFRETSPEVKLIAWIYAGNRAGLGEVDLADPKVRKAMGGEAAWLVKDCGFDGVQWDYE